jgi:Major intrinsic protein
VTYTLSNHDLVDPAVELVKPIELTIDQSLGEDRARHMVRIAQLGAGFNPVRGLAADVFAGTYPALWIYFIGPVLGSAGAAAATVHGASNQSPANYVTTRRFLATCAAGYLTARQPRRATTTPDRASNSERSMTSNPPARSRCRSSRHRYIRDSSRPAS